MKTLKSITIIITLIINSVVFSQEPGGGFDDEPENAPPASPEFNNPSNLTASNITQHAANLSWQAATNNSGCVQKAWGIEVITSTSSPTGSGIVYTGNLPFTITGLTAGTGYKFYVRANCSNYGISNWVGPYSFTTSASLGTNVQNLCTKTIQPYNVNVGDATHDGSTYAWSITPAAPTAVITGDVTNAITIDWANVPDASYTLQAIETSIEGCVSTAVTATINLSATLAPTAQQQTFCTNSTVANLKATGTDLKWYTAATGGIDLASDVALASGTYYVSQTLDSCESTRASVTVTITQLVTPTFTELAAVCSGNVLDALPNTSTNGITGTWSPALNNSETTTYTFTTNAGQCAATTTQTITITKPLITSAISFEVPVTPLPNVTIGTQVWTTKNLDVSTYRDGTPIPQVADSDQWSSITTGAWCYYNNDPANGAVYGKIYNIYALLGIFDAASLNDPKLRKQLAPIGWHVPHDSEWTTLSAFLGGNNISGGKMKETGTNNWTSPNIGANNSTSFTGLPGGYRYSGNGGFYGIGDCGTWWMLSNYTIQSWFRLSSNYESSSDFHGISQYNSDGLSVRVIKD